MQTILNRIRSGVEWRHSWRAQMADYPGNTDRRVREAFQLILRRVEACNANILPNTGREAAERFVLPVLQLACLWKRWQRPACSWEPRATIPVEQFCELARHLLAAYPVPRFMNSVFLDIGCVRYGEWFAHVGAGRNIRTAPSMTAQLTSRMAHCMLEAPDDCSVVGALRRGQVLGLGGDATLAYAVASSRLGGQLYSQADEAFWLCFQQWLVNHPELPLMQVGPLVDFVVARRDRELDFSMKGRSVPAVLRLMHEWHQELQRAPGIGFRVLPRSGFVPHWEVQDERGQLWIVEEIADTYALHAEGQSMRHCVFSYATSVLQGHCSIWSLKVQGPGQSKRALTMEVRNAAKRIVQIRGYGNRLAKSEERRVLSRWAQECGLEVGA